MFKFKFIKKMKKNQNKSSLQIILNKFLQTYKLQITYILWANKFLVFDY